jgi:hypothetical protein
MEALVNPVVTSTSTGERTPAARRLLDETASGGVIGRATLQGLCPGSTRRRGAGRSLRALGGGGMADAPDLTPRAWMIGPDLVLELRG